MLTPMVQSLAVVRWATMRPPSPRRIGSTSGRYSSPWSLSGRSRPSASRRRLRVEGVEARRWSPRARARPARRRAPRRRARRCRPRRAPRGRSAFGSCTSTVSSVATAPAAAVRVDDAAQQLAGDQRRVAGDHEHVAVEALQRLQAALHGVAGAASAGSWMAGRASSPSSARTSSASRRRHDHERVGVRVARRGQHPAQDRAAAQGVQDLRHGASACACPCRPP